MGLKALVVLVVDDNADDRFFMSRVLMKVAPHAFVHYANSGCDAVAYLKGRGVYGDRSRFPFPDVIITDCHMSDGSGFSVLVALHDNAVAFPPVMMLSSSADAEDAHLAYQLGATVYCAKPIGVGPLCEVVSDFFNRVGIASTCGSVVAIEEHA